MPFWDAVIKVGGSLYRSASLDQLLRRLATAARRHRLLVIPGGGPFADAVRAIWRKHHLSERCTHRMALLGMDQFGLLLCDLEPRAVAVQTLAEACRAARSGKLPVLLAARLSAASPELPASWEVTSDSVAAWVAARAGARRLILIKSVDVRRMVEEAGPRSAAAVTAKSLAASGVVDRAFPRFASPRVDAWVVDGRRPASVASALAARPRAAVRIY